VAVRTRPIYVSPNGDRWLLAVDPDSGGVFERHEANLPSGGQVADIEIEAFLIAGRQRTREARTPASDCNAGLGRLRLGRAHRERLIEGRNAVQQLRV
jgi:hypothetical protein